MKSIHTNSAPKVVGPYSQAIEAGNLVFLSGQIGIDPATGTLVEGIEKQTKQVCANLMAVLMKAGVNETNVVKTTVYLANIEDYAVVNDIYADFFGDHRPARAAFAVAALPAGALVEIEAIAVKDNS